jgi:Macrocin-O-methyltransferase (TylF)
MVRAKIPLKSQIPTKSDGSLFEALESEVKMGQLTIFFRELGAGVNQFFRKLARRYVKKVMEIALTGTDLVPAVRAAITSHDFEVQQLGDVPFFATRRDLFKACLEQVRVKDGLHLEFGVYKGDSINLLAKLAPGRHFTGFDSFEGLPETWSMGSRAGAFNVGGKLPAVKKNVTLVKGFYNVTLPGYGAENKERVVAFIHVDCDLYSATRDVLAYLRPMMRPGTILVFDEFYNYTVWLEHEFRAWSEFVQAEKVKFTYIGYIRTGEQVALRIDSFGATSQVP